MYLLTTLLALMLFGHSSFAKDDISTKQAFNNQEVASSMTMEQKRMQALKDKMNSPQEVERVAKEYEEVAINKMLQQLNEGVKPDPIFGGGHAEEIYRDMLMAEHAKIIANAGGIGIASGIKKDMERIDKSRKAEAQNGS